MVKFHNFNFLLKTTATLANSLRPQGSIYTTKPLCFKNKDIISSNVRLWRMGLNPNYTATQATSHSSIFYEVFGIQNIVVFWFDTFQVM